MVALASTVLSLVIGFSAPLTLVTSLPQDSWVPEMGDVFIVDTKENIGYLVHKDGVFFSFKVATGQRRVVHYIGRTYNATTPEKMWVAKSLHIKGDHITYAKNGHFLRLYIDGTEASPYGIHGHAYSERMLSQDIRYESMGCVIVADDIMQIVEQTWKLNSEQLTVVTKYGLGSQQLAAH